MSKHDEKRLHIYSQFSPHDDAVIVGTKGSLAALRDAITRAIESGTGTTDSFTADGEGYSIIVKTRDDISYFDRVGLPYAADCYGNDGSTGLDPRDPEADYASQD